MKVALSSRQTEEYLKQADEIRVKYGDIDVIYDLMEKYFDKNIILELPYQTNEEIKWDTIFDLKKLLANLVIRCYNKAQIFICETNNLQWFFGYPVETWEDFISLCSTNCIYILIGGDLVFSLPKLKNFNKPLKMVPNVSNFSMLAPLGNLSFNYSIVGDWFHPEGLKYFEPYIDYIEFEECTLAQERALFRIYIKQQGWRIGLSQLIKHLYTKAQGRLVDPDEFYPHRIQCGRTCISNNLKGCHLCWNIMDLADYDLLKNYKDNVLNNDEALTDIELINKAQMEEEQDNKENT